MRLSESEVEVIRSCAHNAFGPDCIVRLFGSRTDDARRGGDVDLHVIAPPEAARLTDEIAFKLDLKGRLGDQRFDVVLRPSNHDVRVIDEIAFDTGIVLT